MREFYVSKSGRQYFTCNGALYAFDREAGTWALSARTLQEVAAEGRLYKVQGPEDFIFYARKAYEAFTPTTGR